MKNRMARRLTVYFSAVLLLFAIFVGAIFITLFRNQTIDEARSDLEARAAAIADALAEYSADGGGGRWSMGSGSGSYGGYLRFIDDIAMTDVWIVDEDLNLLMSGMMSDRNYNYADLPEDAEAVVDKAFQGSTTFSEGFSSLLAVQTLTVGTPITVDGAVVGVVLLHAPVEGIDDAVMRGIWVLTISVGAALLLSVLLSVFFALSFTSPLKKMRNSAARLADGDYAAKTDVRREDEIGELAGAIDTLSDRLQAAKQESEKLDKLRRDFVANISHELRTPVTVIRGSLEALCDRVVTEPEQVETYHRQMLDESISLQRLVNDLMDLSKLQNTDFSIEKQELNLCDIVTDAVRSAGQLTKGKTVELQLDMDTQNYPVIGDYGRLRQMLLIVLDNAVKFSPEGETVFVSLKEGTVMIRDRGRGIAEEELPYIFDRFYRVKSEENKTGSGLGLAIAKQIADRHGVNVSVQSRPGEGAEFLFTFPKIGTGENNAAG